jgi:hypothetical protein
LVLPLAACGVGCGSCDPKTENGQAAPAEGESKGGETVAVVPVAGVVRLAEGAELPSYTDRELGIRENVVGRPKGCPPLGDAARTPVRADEAGGLSNVLVSVTGFDTSPPHEATTRSVRINERCVLSPPVIVAVRGDELEIKNESSYPFLPKWPGSSFMQALVKGQLRTVSLDRGGVQPLRCAFAAPCGRSDVIVQYHPVFGVTEEGGAFRIANVPQGKKLQLHAWHPLFKPAKQRLSTADGTPVQVELVLTPRERPEEEPEAEEKAAGSDEGGDDEAGMAEM